jgi:hypothetical protein
VCLTTPQGRKAVEDTKADGAARLAEAAAAAAAAEARAANELAEAKAAAAAALAVRGPATDTLRGGEHTRVQSLTQSRMQ